MKTKDSPGSISKGSSWQIAAAILLVGIPVLMIVFNGVKAIRGIMWNFPPSGISSSYTGSEGKNDTLHISRENGTGAPVFGVYDSDRTFSKDTCFAFEQAYLSWMELDEKLLHGKIESIISRNRIPVITIEPWNGHHDEKTLLKDITRGDYDENIGKVTRLLSGFQGKFFISWGHEMDQDITKRYPWSGSDPKLFISAYRYFTDKLRKGVSNEIRMIWSPVCKQGCERYWPGGDYVDYIGMPVYSYPEWDRSYYGHIRSFRSWFGEKYSLVSSFNKPVIIMEMGVTGSTDYQVYWLQEAFTELKTTPSVKAVLFYHSKDIPNAWGTNVQTPDWRTDPGIIKGFVNWIRKEN